MSSLSSSMRPDFYAARSAGPVVMEREPRPIATRPDCTISLMPYGSRSRSSASSLSGLPVASMVSVSGATSITRARNSSTVSSTWLRCARSARTLTSSNSRWTDWPGSSSTIFSTFTSLLSCLVTCSRGEDSALTTIVMRETSGFSVSPTASESMLKLRRENRPETRASTPGLFSTRTESVCLLLVGSWSQVVVVEVRAHIPGEHDLVVAGAGGDHGPHHGVLADREVDDHRRVVDLHRGLDGGVDVVLGLAAQADAAERLGELHEIR